MTTREERMEVLGGQMAVMLPILAQNLDPEWAASGWADAALGLVQRWDELMKQKQATEKTWTDYHQHGSEKPLQR